MSKTKRIAKYIKQEKQIIEDNCIELLNDIETLQNNIVRVETDLITYNHFNLVKDELDIACLEKDRLMYEKELILKKLELELEISKLANKNANLNWIEDKNDFED